MLKAKDLSACRYEQCLPCCTIPIRYQHDITPLVIAELKTLFFLITSMKHKIIDTIFKEPLTYIGAEENQYFMPKCVGNGTHLHRIACAMVYRAGKCSAQPRATHLNPCSRQSNLGC